MILIIIKGFSKITKFNQGHFQTRNFNCTAVEVTTLNFKTSACLFKTESIWKLGHFNCQWTKTLYENILSHLAFFLGTDNFNFTHTFFFHLRFLLTLPHDQNILNKFKLFVKREILVVLDCLRRALS